MEFIGRDRDQREGESAGLWRTGQHVLNKTMDLFFIVQFSYLGFDLGF